MAVKVPVALGGTGASTAADARANLGVSSNTSGGVYSNVLITSSNVSGNITVNTGNVMLSKAGANVTFEAPGSTVVGAQFKTPGIHDLSTQRVITLKSNNYSGNRGTGGGDYVVPTMNIKAKYNNVSINTAGRIIYSNRFDDESLMPDVAKYQGFVAFDRNPGGPGVLYYNGSDTYRHKILSANADVVPATNITYSIGSAAAQWTDLRVANDIMSTSGNVITTGLQVGGSALFIADPGDEASAFKIGMGTNDPQFGLDVRSNVYISGNLTVKGNVFVVDTQHLIVDDPVIELGANVTPHTDVPDEGILMNQGSSPNVFLGYDQNRSEMVTSFTSDPSSVSTITIAGYTSFRANSTVFAVEGDTKKTNFSKVAIGTASPKPYKVDIRGNTYISGNVAVGKGIVVGYTDGRVPQANLDVKGNVYIDGNTHVRDQQRIEFGTGKDLLMYHSGAYGYITNSTGTMHLGSDALNLTNQAVNETYIAMVNGGSVTLYYDNSPKLITASGGVNVTGNLSVTRGLAVGWTDGEVPEANLSVNGNVYIDGTTVHDGDVTFTGASANALWDKSDNALEFADNASLRFGAGTDLKLFHDGSNSYIQDGGDGTLYIEGSGVSIRNVGGTEAMATFTPDGSVSLNYDNVKKFETTGTGITVSGIGANVTGNVSVTRSLAVGYTDGRVPQANLDVKGNVYISDDVFFSGANYDLLWDETTSKLKFYDSAQACFGDGNDLQIYHGGTHSFIKNSTGQLRIKGDDIRLRNKQDLVDYIRLDNSGGNSNVRIYHNNAEKLETTGTGITVSGIGANVTGNVSVTRSLAIGWTDGRVPQANLEVLGNANVGILTATSLRVNGSPVSTTSTFLGLTDTPSSYSSQAGKLAAVNSATNAIEFVDDNAVVMAIALG